MKGDFLELCDIDTWQKGGRPPRSGGGQGRSPAVTAPWPFLILIQNCSHVWKYNWDPWTPLNFIPKLKPHGDPWHSVPPWTPWILFQNCFHLCEPGWNPWTHGPLEFYFKIHGELTLLNFNSNFMGTPWIYSKIDGDPWPLEFIPKFVIEFFIGTPKWYQTAKRAVSLFLDVMTELEPVRSLSYIKDAGSSCMNGPRLPDFAKVNAAPKESSMSRKIHLRT